MATAPLSKAMDERGKGGFSKFEFYKEKQGGKRSAREMRKTNGQQHRPCTAWMSGQCYAKYLPTRRQSLIF